MTNVEELLRDVQKQRTKRKAEALSDALSQGRDATLAEARQRRRRMVYPQLPSSAEPQPGLQLYCQPCHTENVPGGNELIKSFTPPEELPNKQNEHLGKVRMRSSRNRVTTVSVPVRTLEGTHEPLPKSNATIFLKTHYATEDEQNLTYVPYFGDDDREDVVSELYNMDERAKQMEFGPEYQERDTNDIIDETITRLAKQLDGAFSSDVQKLLSNDLADIMDVSVERILKRFKACCGTNGNVLDVTSKKKTGEEPKKNSSTKIPLKYKEVMDSYRTIFCRRCFTYDCNMHGNLSKPSLEVQGELAIQKERDGYWDKQKANPSDAVASAVTQKKRSSITAWSKNRMQGRLEKQKGVPRKEPSGSISRGDQNSPPMATELTALQKSVCERAFLVFQGNVDKMAAALGAQRNVVASHASGQHLSLQEFRHVKPEVLVDKRRKRGTEKTSMKNYNFAWLRRVEDAEIHPLFFPCDHEGPCSEENCTCVKNRFFCTKHCVWGDKSRNFFRGCACKGGKCGTKSCACFAAKRECDPDLCRTCGACTDPPNQPATRQRCRNDNIGMRRHCHLLLAKSTIADAGWGIYTKYTLKKGDFVHEYVGEVISQEEAERRGRIYDKVNRSYLFNLSSDYVVDASRKGNKTRFANHSSKPNCYTKMVCVNGDIRIGLFAKEDIEPQSELFFDYRYDVGMDNDLIIKPGKTVDWMKNPKMANKVSKKRRGDSGVT